MKYIFIGILTSRDHLESSVSEHDDNHTQELNNTGNIKLESGLQFLTAISTEKSNFLVSKYVTEHTACLPLVF